ncbi:MAG: hypothetical protein IPL96_11950 [Holophagaceae bacterium]|nr:hypothetical protein [Holophagaceae bacterium]
MKLRIPAPGAAIRPILPRYRLAAPFQIMVRQGQANHDLKGCLSKVKGTVNRTVHGQANGTRHGTPR